MTTTETDRGQVFLITAVIIAIVILSLIAIANVASFSQTDEAERGANTEVELEDAVDDLIYNAEQTIRVLNTVSNRTFSIDNPDESDRLNSIRQNIGTYIENTTYSQYRNVSVDVIDTQNNATRIWGTGPDTGIQPLGVNTSTGYTEKVSDYTLLDPSNRADIREFTLKLDTTSMDAGDTGEIEIQSPSNTYDIAFTDTISIDGNQISNADFSGSYNEQSLTLSLTEGTLNNDPIDNKFPSGSPLTTIEEVRVTNSEDINASINVIAQENTQSNILAPDNNTLETPLYEFPTSTTDSGNRTTETDTLEAHKALYSMTVELTVSTELGTTTRTIELAPGRTE